MPIQRGCRGEQDALRVQRQDEGTRNIRMPDANQKRATLSARDIEGRNFIDYLRANSLARGTVTRVWKQLESHCVLQQ